MRGLATAVSFKLNGVPVTGASNDDMYEFAMEKAAGNDEIDEPLPTGGATGGRSAGERGVVDAGDRRVAVLVAGGGPLIALNGAGGPRGRMFPRLASWKRRSTVCEHDSLGAPVPRYHRALAARRSVIVVAGSGRAKW